MTDLDARIRGALQELAEPAGSEGVMERLRARQEADGDGPDGPDAETVRRGWWIGLLGGLGIAILLGVVLTVTLRDDSGEVETSGSFDDAVVDDETRDGEGRDADDGRTGRDEPADTRLDAPPTGASAPSGPPSSSVPAPGEARPAPSEGGSPGPPVQPSPAPIDSSGPVLVGAGVAPGEVWENAPVICGDHPVTAEISVLATDPSGLASVRATWTVADVDRQVALLPVAGVHRATFGPYPNFTLPDNEERVVTITITATDTVGNRSSTSRTVVLHSAGQCFQ